MKKLLFIIILFSFCGNDNHVRKTATLMWSYDTELKKITSVNIETKKKNIHFVQDDLDRFRAFHFNCDSLANPIPGTTKLFIDSISPEARSHKFYIDTFSKGIYGVCMDAIDKDGNKSEFSNYDTLIIN